MSQMAHPVLELSQAPALKEQQEGTFVKKSLCRWLSVIKTCLFTSSLSHKKCTKPAKLNLLNEQWVICQEQSAPNQAVYLHATGKYIKPS